MLVEDALTGKKVVGASAGEHHTAAWTDAGELFTCGSAFFGKLGHEGQDYHSCQRVPMLVEALEGKKVVDTGKFIKY